MYAQECTAHTSVSHICSTRNTDTDTNTVSPETSVISLFQAGGNVGLCSFLMIQPHSVADYRLVLISEAFLALIIIILCEMTDPIGRGAELN